MATSKRVDISRSELQSIATPATATITNVTPLSSYNWIEAATPTIAVPGCPSRWNPPQGSHKVKQDHGLIYIAQNAARHPSSPLEPLFRALYLADPSYDVTKIDVITDRNNIRKLLSFVNPATSKNGLEPFTIRVEVKNNTAILCRTETQTVEVIARNQFRGFGHEFEKAYTTCALPNSTGHHRIISYKFGDLSFLVRHETDGYVKSPTQADQITRDDSSPADNSGLSGLLGTLNLGPSTATSSTAASPATESKLTVIETGHVIPLADTIEIKTRVSHKPFKFSEVAVQLWASQTPKLVRAHHTRGVFKDPPVDDVTPSIQSWQKAHQDDLKKLAALIQTIRDAVKECGGRAVLHFDGVMDKLKILEDKSTTMMLPADLYTKWETKAAPEIMAAGSAPENGKDVGTPKGESGKTPKGESGKTPKA
jgi:hypothetical protein